MSTGQVFLALASLILLGYITLNINQMYLSSVETSVDMQMTSDAVNFGRDVSERLQSYAYRYDELVDDFGDIDDVEDEDKRLSYTTQVGETFFATVDLSGESALTHGQVGRTATITVYELVDGDYELKAEYVTVIINLE